MPRRGIVMLLVSLLPSLLLSQGVDIRGVISDSTTAEKLPFANVVLVGTSKGAASNISPCNL